MRCLILSSLAFSLMTVCVKQLNGRLPVPEIVLSRALISVGLTGLGLQRGELLLVGTKLLRGLAHHRCHLINLCLHG